MLKKNHKLKVPENPIIDAKQMLGACTEFCYLLPNGEEKVWRIRSVGTEEWEMWKRRWDELKAELGNQCEYFYRIAP